MTKPKFTQPSFFQQGEDLPLFSGAAPKGHVEPFDPTPPEAKQDPLPVDCRLCRDTGKLGELAFCTCEAGQRARAIKRKQDLIQDARALSSGTLAGLTGLRRYDNIERVQNSFINWCYAFHAAHPEGFKTWQEAWGAYWESCQHIITPLKESEEKA